jgi:hypothetical protein
MTSLNEWDARIIGMVSNDSHNVINLQGNYDYTFEPWPILEEMKTGDGVEFGKFRINEYWNNLSREHIAAIKYRNWFFVIEKPTEHAIQRFARKYPEKRADLFGKTERIVGFDIHIKKKVYFKFIRLRGHDPYERLSIWFFNKIYIIQ